MLKLYVENVKGKNENFIVYSKRTVANLFMIAIIEAKRVYF